MEKLLQKTTKLTLLCHFFNNRSSKTTGALVRLDLMNYNYLNVFNSSNSEKMKPRLGPPESSRGSSQVELMLPILQCQFCKC